MAEKKISELNSLTGANAATGDLLPIVDVSATETKKITRAEFFTNTPDINGRDIAADGSKLDGIEANADVTDTANVTAAGALMDSELTDEAAVKALDQGVATTDDPTFTNTQLAAIAETKAVTAVDVFVYDTSKDSDGGAWRKRTQHTSWYNETLNTATRGARREFPAVAVIVAEAAKVTIYDGDDPSLPMWMVFDGGAASMAGLSGGGAGATFSLNGWVSLGNNANDLVVIDFFGDRAARAGTGSIYGPYNGNISERNDDKVWTNTNSFLSNGPIVSRTVNDVAMTVLPDAPIDPATGLPVPTIAVATDGGISVITDSGAVYDSADTATMIAVDFNPQNILAFTRGGNTNRIAETYDADGFGSADLYTTVEGYIANGTSDLAFPSLERVRSGNVGLERLYLDTSALSSSLHSFTTATYTTGWLNGDAKGAFLSDTDDTDLVGSGELVTNGTFDTDTDWTKGTGWTISGGAASHASGASSSISQSISLTVGKTYVASVDITAISGAGWGVNLREGGRIIANFTNDGSTTGTLTGTFVATEASPTLDVTQGSGGTVTIDNISVKLADADRSVNNNGLIVNGTVTRTPVATGADLVAYSGFSASNYLEAPYNPDLDFGTGDFCVMGWVKTTDVFGIMLERRTGGTEGFALGTYSGSDLSLRFELGGLNFDTTSELQSNSWSYVCVGRKDGQVFGYINAEDAGISGANSTDVSVTAPLRFGLRYDGSANLTGSLALWRISATAPTAEQIKKIYEDEKFLFQDGSQATLYGSSDAVTALAHDPVTDLLHVGTSAGRSVFQGLRRVSNTTTAVGTAISASNGLVAEE